MEKREYVIRSCCYRYKQLTVPNECTLKVGDAVDLLFDGSLIVVVPRGAVVNEKLLAKVVKQAALI